MVKVIGFRNKLKGDDHMSDSDDKVIMNEKIREAMIEQEVHLKNELWSVIVRFGKEYFMTTHQVCSILDTIKVETQNYMIISEEEANEEEDENIITEDDFVDDIEEIDNSDYWKHGKDETEG